MDADPAPVLARARDAYAQRSWADALGLLLGADALAPLDVPDLERLAWSAGMLDRDAELLAACERLFDACLQRGDEDRAAYWAFFHGFRLLALGEAGRASAWMQRARHLVDQGGRECAVAGYLLIPSIHRQLAAGEHAEAAEAAARALAIAERCGEVDLAAFARCLLGRARVRQGRVDEGIPLLDEAMLVAVGGRLTPIITGLVYCHLIDTCRQVFAVDRAREWTDALSRWCGAQPQLVQFNGVCLLHRAELFELHGQWQASLAEAQRATRSLARANAAQTEAGAAYQEAEIHRLRGEFDLADERYRSAGRLGLEPQPGMALLRLAQGRSDQAVAALRRLLAVTADPLKRARLLPAWVEISIAAGAPEPAREACAELERTAGEFATEVLSAMALQARGELELSEGDAASALPRLHAALQLWRRADAPYIEARLRLRIGQACRALGDDEGAQMEFDAARAAFESLGALPDLARLPSPGAAAQRSLHDRLTARELEVLRLVAAGHSNKRIAIALGLSGKTVDRHLSNIFDKLGVSSRAAATAFAFRHDLV